MCAETSFTHILATMCNCKHNSDLEIILPSVHYYLQKVHFGHFYSISVVCLQCNAIENLFKEADATKQQVDFEISCFIFSSFKSVQSMLQSNCLSEIVELALCTQDWPEDLFIVVAKFLCTLEIIKQIN